MTGNPDPSLTIDTHHHILPDFFWQETENAHAPVGGLAPLRWSREASVSFMDDAGIDVAVVSVSTPGVHTGDSAKASALARRCNECAAELVCTKPDRFASFACLPLPDIDASLEELTGINQVLYGTDFPYQRRDLAAKSKQVLQSSALNDVERGAVLGGNAARLFPRLQSVLANGG
jgi:predicted TIM-barrel fold metal-dependent hydrolase